MLHLRNLLMTWSLSSSRNRFGRTLQNFCLALILAASFCQASTFTNARDRRHFWFPQSLAQHSTTFDALPNDVQQNIPQPRGEAELYGSVPLDSLDRGYGEPNNGRIERIDNPLQQLPDIVEERPTQEVTLTYQFPDERRPARVINSLKQIHDYSVQRRLIRTLKNVTRKYTKKVFLNTVYNTNIQKVQHNKLVNVLQNSLQQIDVPKLIVHYTKSSTVSDNLPVQNAPLETETVQEETQQLPIITQPAQVELIVNTPDPCGASSPSLAADWELFKKRFNRSYPNPDSEKERKINWACNLGAIDDNNKDFNRGRQAFSMGMNGFGDLVELEFSSTYLGSRTTEEDDGRRDCSDHVISGLELPASVDWRTMDIVSPVKDQEECGSCWAFSAVGALEGQQAIILNRTRLLSEQRLVDCSKPEGNMGCDGGYPNHAFAYVMKNGIDVEADYPYQGINDTCKVNGSTLGTPSITATTAAAAETSSSDDVTQKLRVVGCRNIPQGNERALMDAIATVGPVSVCMDSSQTAFQFYAGGIYDPANCTIKVDHGMLAVGYGTLNGKDYWLIKNSFGTGWGVNGYMYLARGKNKCGITTTASYPVIEKPPRILTTTTTTTTPPPPVVYYNYYYPAGGHHGPPGNYPYEPPYGNNGGSHAYGGYGGKSLGYRTSLPRRPLLSSRKAATKSKSDSKIVKYH